MLGPVVDNIAAAVCLLEEPQFQQGCNKRTRFAVPVRSDLDIVIVHVVQVAGRLVLRGKRPQPDQIKKRDVAAFAHQFDYFRMRNCSDGYSDISVHE